MQLDRRDVSHGLHSHEDCFPIYKQICRRSLSIELISTKCSGQKSPPCVVTYVSTSCAQSTCTKTLLSINSCVIGSSEEFSVRCSVYLTFLRLCRFWATEFNYENTLMCIRTGPILPRSRAPISLRHNHIRDHTVLDQELGQALTYYVDEDNLQEMEAVSEDDNLNSYQWRHNTMVLADPFIVSKVCLSVLLSDHGSHEPHLP